ncbi:RNA pyrophosphohydrolase [Pelagibacteraceae bacterium]|nr:RNA pyrophosphohydrolase [Pelagibacteraceae bacterium]
MKNNNSLPLRIGVGIALLNDKNKIFVGKRIDNPKNFWQLPQGGVDDNENYLDAAKRELKEETSIKSVKLIKQLDGWLKYDLPENLIGKVWNGKYGGQKQKWFIMKFLGNDKEININTKHPEFLEWKWIEINKITDFVVDFKLNIYKEIKEKIKEIIS